jgi:signal transduction histidine kinase
LTSVALAWVAAAAYSRLVAPLDGTLSESAFALAAAFAVAALSRRRLAVAGLALCWVGQLAGVGAADPLGEAALLLLSWMGGLAVNEASRLVEQTRANNDLLRRQEATSSARAAVEERLRLAREIHDAIGHSLTVVALHAGAARRLEGTDPERAGEVMRTVASVARSGVASLALGDASTDIASLVERVRATGLVVDADLAGAALLDPGQQRVAFRVVQEGLTNVLRHAPGSRAMVEVRGRDGAVEIVVANSAPLTSGSGPGTGRGLAGIRERVRAAAGQVTWRTREDGGFEVCARMPGSSLVVPAP